MELAVEEGGWVVGGGWSGGSRTRIRIGRKYTSLIRERKGGGGGVLWVG